MLEELLHAIIGMTLLATLVSLIYWAFTGLSPWPFVVLGEVIGGALGVIILVATKPSR